MTQDGASKPHAAGGGRDDPPRAVLGGLTATTFLRDHWQRRPLLVRGAFTDFADPIDPDSLAGLACDPEVASRLVYAASADTDYRVETGPFADEALEQLPPRGWSLLVQGVDRWDPDVAALLAPFRFLPDWRIDDIMVSFSTAGGGVGPHYDFYDVFLIQGVGRRRWRIGQACGPETPLRPHPDLQLLARFDAVADLVLEPGDMLYLPPGLAHDGVALTDSLTYSVGFRAPSVGDMLAGFGAFAGAELPEHHRFGDAGRRPAASPGRIDDASLERVADNMRAALDDRSCLARWFGATMTAPKDEDLAERLDPPLDADAVAQGLAEGAVLRRALGSRLAYWPDPTTGTITLFADETTYALPGEETDFVVALCVAAAGPAVELPRSLSPLTKEVLTALVNAGTVMMGD